MEERLKNLITDAALGAVFGSFFAYRSRSDVRTFTALGAVLGTLGGGLLRAHYEAQLSSPSSFFTGWAPPPHPIEVMPSFNPSARPVDQARSVITDYYHDDDLRSWVDNDAVKKAFGVKQKEDYDPTQLIAAYENKSSPVWQRHGSHLSWAEMNAAVQKAIAKRKKLGPLPKASYDKDPIVIYYYDNDRMKKVEYARANLPMILNPGNHYYWRDPSVHTYETQNPAVIADERAHPGRSGNNGWGGEGFDWDKDAVGQISSIVQTTLQLIGFAMQATGYLAAVGSVISKASPYIGTLLGMADDAFQGNDNAKAVAAIAKVLIQAANAGVGEAAGVELPPVAMQALGQGVDVIGQQISAGQQKHLDYTGIWTNILNKAKSFHKIGDQEAHAISQVLGENAAGKTFIQGYQAGKLSDLPTIDAISKMFNNQGNANVYMLGAGLGQLAVHQGQH